MRTFSAVFPILLATIFVSCCKDKDPSIPYFDFVVYWEGLQEQGSAEADVFDKEWGASAFVYPHHFEPEYINIYFQTYTGEGFLREQISFGAFSPTVGKYSVVYDTSTNYSDYVINGNYSTYSDDGDVLNGSYSINKDYENVVFVDIVDTINHEIEGRFSLMFDLDESDFDKDLARRVLFENGKFKVKI